MKYIRIPTLQAPPHHIWSKQPTNTMFKTRGSIDNMDRTALLPVFIIVATIHSQSHNAYQSKNKINFTCLHGCLLPDNSVSFSHLTVDISTVQDPLDEL